MVRAYLFLAVFIPLTFLFSVSAIISTLFDSSGRVYAWHARLWARLGLALNGITVTITGTEQLPDGPVIFMSNHQSTLIFCRFWPPSRARSIGSQKKELFEIPVFGPSMRRGGYIPLDRSDGRKALQSVDEAAATIHHGKSVVLFPEGTRTPDGNLLPFKVVDSSLRAKRQCRGSGHHQRQRPSQPGGPDQTL